MIPDDDVCMMDEWFMAHVPAHWVLTAVHGPWIFGAPQNWTTEANAVGPDGEYPPDPPKCKDCKGEGKVTLFTGIVDCETCDGSGY